MVTTDAETDLTIGFESTARCHEAEARRAKRICGGQDYAAMVNALAVDGVRRATEGKMPFKQIRLQRLSEIIESRRVRQFGSLTD